MGRWVKTWIAVTMAVAASGPFWGCGSRDATERSGWRETPDSTLTAGQQVLKDRAFLARSQLFGRLSRELMAALEASGPAGAIEVCRDAAPRIGAEVAEENDLRIGRTSHLLRNPRNTAPDWTREAVEARAEDPRFYAGPAGELGVLLPIRTAPLCVDCHGPAENLSPEVAAALAEAYPDDRATGFIPGDLRGWFWIEVGP